MVETLGRQLAALTKEVRRNRQDSNYVNDGNDNEDTFNVLENPYGNRKREERNWEPNIKIDLPKFFGSLIPKDLIDWLNQTKSIFCQK